MSDRNRSFLNTPFIKIHRSDPHREGWIKRDGGEYKMKEYVEVCKLDGAYTTEDRTRNSLAVKHCPNQKCKDQSRSRVTGDTPSHTCL